jgi:cytochrome b561
MGTGATLKYDRTTVSLHWITALFVAALWLIGQTADRLPRGPARSAYWSTHVVIGFALVLALIVRVLWRTTTGRRLPDPDKGVLNILAKSTHYGLYVLLAIVLILGLANAFVRGFDIFGAVALPRIGDSELRRPINQWHELGADVLLALAALHAAAALAHRFLWRDGVLGRISV